MYDGTLGSDEVNIPEITDAEKASGAWRAFPGIMTASPRRNEDKVEVIVTMPESRNRGMLAAAFDNLRQGQDHKSLFLRQSHPAVVHPIVDRAYT